MFACVECSDVEKTAPFESMKDLFKFPNLIISVEAPVGKNTARQSHLVPAASDVNQ